LQNELAKLGF